MNKEAAEKLLLMLLDMIPGRNEQAVMVQSFIAEQGPLSEETATKVRERWATKRK